jgi:hypothetical protein
VRRNAEEPLATVAPTTTAAADGDDDAEAVALLKVLVDDQTNAQRKKRKRGAKTTVDAKEEVAPKKESPKRRKHVDSSDDDDADDSEKDPDFHASQESDASSDDGASMSDDGSDHEFEDGEQRDGARRLHHHQPHPRVVAAAPVRAAVQVQPARQAPRPAVAVARRVARDALGGAWSPPPSIKPKPIASNRMPNKNEDIAPFRQGSLIIPLAAPKVQPLPKDAGLLDSLLELQNKSTKK